MPGTVIQVDGGRGFVIETGVDRFVVTAAHCLAQLPEAFGAAGGYAQERIYADFLGPLGASSNVSAECIFVDPVADLAVFGEPNSELGDQFEAYRELIDSAEAFPLGKLRFRPRRLSAGGAIARGLREATSKALMLSLEGDWFPCRVRSLGRTLWIEDAAQEIRGGMSGSPIILPDGSAIGVACVSGDTMNGPNPMLSASLPAWLARDAQNAASTFA
jgi:hypothetical protein